MQNMKKLLSALTALSFVTVAGVSTVACNSCNTKKDSKASMDNTVLADLGLYDKDGKSLVGVRITTGPTASWGSEQLSDIKAGALLTAENKAKTENSFNFLTGVLKLEAKGSGAWNQKTFDKAQADAIELSVVSISPTLKAITGDFAVSGGTAKVQWKQDTKTLGVEYSINLKVDEKGVVKDALPAAADLKLTDFDTTKEPLSKFAKGLPKNGVPVGANIGELLKDSTEKGKEVYALVKLINQPLKVTIKEVTAVGENFADGDSLKVAISLGSVEFSIDYKLELGQTY